MQTIARFMSNFIAKLVGQAGLAGPVQLAQLA